MLFTSIFRFCTRQTEPASGVIEQNVHRGYQQIRGRGGGFGVNMFNKRHLSPAIFFIKHSFISIHEFRHFFLKFNCDIGEERTNG